MTPATARRAAPPSSLSFVRGLFAGAVHDSLLFPYPETLDVRDSAEAAVVVRIARDLRALVGDVINDEEIDELECVPEVVIEAFAKIGMLGLTIPREYGGLGLSATAYARVFGELSTISPSLAVLVGVHCGLGAKAIVLFGNDDQKARYLPVLARGETLAAYALTEPEIGSDAQNIRTRATRTRDGWQLDGRKIWIGNGHRAGVIATFAQTEVERRGERVLRPTAFIVRPDMPGFRVAGTVRKLGIRGSTQAELAYENLLVPDDHVLGSVGRGFSVAVHVLNGGRLTLAAGCTAGARAVLGQMATWSEHRVQFGRPIAAFEITQRKLSDLATGVYAADSMLGVLAALVDRRDVDYSLEAACAKVFASDLIWKSCDEMVQVAGGRGFVRPYPYERALRDARINRIFEGTNEILRLFVALNGIEGPAGRLREVGSALRRPLRNLGLISGFAASRIRSMLGASASIDAPMHERLKTHREYFEKHCGELRAQTERAIIRYRREIIERQLVLERLANMAIELFATACVIARTQKLLDERGIDGCAHELELCDLFCVEAGRRFRDNRNALETREEVVDDDRRGVAARVRVASGYSVPDSILDIR
ncbi:MAG: acyl-CoA dehydrogenase family protein [Gemmatimonadota bacterium]